MLKTIKAIREERIKQNKKTIKNVNDRMLLDWCCGILYCLSLLNKKKTFYFLCFYYHHIHNCRYKYLNSKAYIGITGCIIVYIYLCNYII